MTISSLVWLQELPWVCATLYFSYCTLFSIITYFIHFLSRKLAGARKPVSLESVHATASSFPLQHVSLFFIRNSFLPSVLHQTLIDAKTSREWAIWAPDLLVHNGTLKSYHNRPVPMATVHSFPTFNYPAVKQSLFSRWLFRCDNAFL